ncbi:MAG: hypothetical protein ABI383_07965 [Acidobacteriaceae bacterium]
MAKQSPSILVLALLMVLFVPLLALAQKGEGPIDPAPPKGHTPDEIIKIVAAKEKEFQAARERYVYRQDVKVEEYDGSAVAGTFREISDITFDDRGKRSETVVFAPQNGLQKIQMTRQDIDDIENHFPFVVTTDTLPTYDIKYVGHQQVDELGTYVFDLDPVHMEKNKRYFKGRIWVDDQDLMIVKTSGVGVPNPKENQPVPFTTWREQIDGKYWFPTYTSGQADIKAYDHGQVVDSTPVRVIVKYTDYKQYRSTVKITYGDEVPNTNAPQAPAAPQTTPPPPPNPK